MNENDLNGRGLKLLIKEVKNYARRKAGGELKDKERRGYSGTGVERRHSRTVVIVVIKAWKGCIKYWRIRSPGKSSSRNGKESPAGIQIFPHRIFSVLIVGRRDIASLMNIKITAYLRPANVENLLCIDEEEEKAGVK